MLGRRSILALVATAIFVTATFLTFTSNVSASSTITGLTIITPTEGEYLGGTYTITWTVTGSLDGDEMYNVHYYDPEKSTWVVIQNCIAHDGDINDIQSVNWDTSGLTETSGYKVRVQCWESGTKTQEVVVEDLTIDNTAPTIASDTLTYPNGGEYLSGTVTITWNSADITDDNLAASPINIYYSDDGGVNWNTIATGEANDGSYDWDTTSVSDGNQYLIKIEAVDLAGNTASDQSDATFTIDNTKPTVTVTYPVGGEYLSGTVTMTWTTTDNNPGTVDIEYSADGGETWNPIATGETDDGSYEWDTTLLSDGSNYLIRITPTDKAGNTGTPDTSDATFTIDNTPPEITLTMPTEGSYHANIDSITGTATDVTSGVDSVYVAIYSYSHGKWWNAIAGDWSNDEPSLMQATIENNLWRLNQGLPDWENAQKYMVTATAVDSAGNSASVYANFTILGLHLYKGWNLVSVPRELENPSIEAVFEGVTSVARVYYYDPTSEEWRWAIYDDGEWDTSGGLTTIDDGKGYWIYATAETNVTLTLKEIEPPYVPPTYQIKAGWNMIGYTSINLQPTMNVTTYLSSLNSWTVIYKYDTSSGTFYMAKPGYYQFNDVALTEGYWLYSEIDDELVP